jgi:hypothetical protein
VHCLDKHRFGKGNLGYEGILMFFNTHICNEFCQFLGLVNPRDTGELRDDFRLLPDIEILASSHGRTVSKLCDLCRGPIKVNYYRYME